MSPTDLLPDFDPNLDLVLDRVVPVPASRVWKAWTTPAHLVHWFCPKPWQTTECEIDLRPGGKFRTVMCGPNGERFDSSGCYLEVVPNTRLVWTDTLLPGYRPAPEPFFTAMLFLEEVPGGTRYVAIARHGSAETREKHQQMGFHEGWGTVIDQLVAWIQENPA